ncbi:MAG: hypothetical protein K9G27_00290 [Sphingomonadaceae bacterium]|jgi:enamine deaminase RidA (YjgF/YER057c/UK114 family)|uniref:RidA family protein n=1 Tax=Sphingorhabdus sp. TaxID=1902408 RepID=UPI002FD9D254|nr:hypothetical protein [Sphingomonadaceae bacterium]
MFDLQSDSDVTDQIHTFDVPIKLTRAQLEKMLRAVEADVDAMTDFNMVYREFFAEPYPTRSTIVSALVVPDAMVEVEAIAYRESK